MRNEQFFSRENIASVIRMLEQSAQPLPVTKLAKAIPKSVPIPKKDLPELLKQLLKQLVETGEIRSGKAKSIVYWLPKLEEQASERILEPLRESPLTQTDLKNKLPSLLLGWPASKREEMLARLIKEKRVYRVASLAGNAKLLSLRAELTPRDYVWLALQLAVVKLKPKGLNSEQVYALAQELLQPVSTAPPESAPLTSTLAPSNLAVSNLVTSNPEQLILERMTSIEPAAATGALVSLSELRQSLLAEVPGKAGFDQAVLELAGQGQVALHRHDYVSSLSEAECDALVSDERGNYFVGIALRI